MILLRKHVTLAFIFYIRTFCVVCHTKLHLSVHVLLGQHHLYPLGLIIKFEERAVENSHLNNRKNIGNSILNYNWQT